MHPRRRNRPTRGALLLETIVAMTILSSVGLVLMSWMQQSLQSVTRLAQVDRESRLESDALALVERVNPMRQPAGQVTLETMLVRWEAAALQPPRPGVHVGMVMGGGDAIFQVALYKLTVTIEPRMPGTAARQFELVRIGWQPAAARPPEAPPR